MKKFIFILPSFLFVLIAHSLFSQTNKDTLNNCELYVNNYDVLYSEFDNKIKLKFTNPTSSIVSIKLKYIWSLGEEELDTSSFKLYKKNDVFIFNSKIKQGIIQFKIEYTNSDSVKFEEVFYYKLFPINQEVTLLAKRTDGFFCSKFEISKYPFFEVLKFDTLCTEIKVTSFSISVYNGWKKDSPFTRVDVFDNRLDDKAITMLVGGTAIGQNVYIEQIKAKDLINNKILDLPPMIFIITQ